MYPLTSLLVKIGYYYSNNVQMFKILNIFHGITCSQKTSTVQMNVKYYSNTTEE